jgi:hypothetical protein
LINGRAAHCLLCSASHISAAAQPPEHPRVAESDGVCGRFHGAAVPDEVFCPLNSQGLLILQWRQSGGCAEEAGQRPVADARGDAAERVDLGEGLTVEVASDRRGEGASFGGSLRPDNAVILR